MHLHILGIAGTFMSGLALLAREAGFKVTGSDAHCYPPISHLLTAKGIEWSEGYEDLTQALAADCVVVGNAVKRGMPVMEAVLNAGKPYISGPQWLAENILTHKRVLAVAGTHGKTTTTSMLAFILERAGLNPGFLIGGVAPYFETNARLGIGEWFVIEADEYDSAFFDKRPKFMHYRPECAVLNNLEFDHADIYSDLSAIQQQFHYLLRTIPSKGCVLKPRDDEALNQVLSQGYFCRVEALALNGQADWRAELLKQDGSVFRVFHETRQVAEVHWSLLGQFNVENGLAALSASVYAGVSPEVAAQALSDFTPVKRRLEVKSNAHDITIYDDFAHHPTAIEKTLGALKRSGRHQRIVVVLEFASYTMRSGVHMGQMAGALSHADAVYLLQPQAFDLTQQAEAWSIPHQIFPGVQALAQQVIDNARAGDAILVMSNRGFDGIHETLSQGIAARFSS